MAKKILLILTITVLILKFMIIMLITISVIFAITNIIMKNAVQ